MPNGLDIQFLIRIWSYKTFLEDANDCKILKSDEALFRKTIAALNALGLTNKKIDGHTVEGLGDRIYERENVHIVFSEIFYKVYASYFSPAFYIAKIVEQIGDTCENPSGVVARGWRAFPSFIREKDLIEKIQKTDLFKSCNLRWSSDPEQDRVEHTDIKILYNGQEYRFWSYQSTSRGLKNTADRVRGNRRCLPKGIHVMFPIDTDSSKSKQSEDFYGWRLYTQQYVDAAIRYVFRTDLEYDDYDKIKRMDDQTLWQYLKRVHVFNVN